MDAAIKPETVEEKENEVKVNSQHKGGEDGKTCRYCGSIIDIIQLTEQVVKIKKR